MFSTRHLRSVFALFLASAAVALLGCGGQSAEDLPKTYQVRGVVLKANGEKLTGGSVEFSPKQPGGLRFLGTIDPDGSFTARTIGASAAAAGAPEGTYTAVVMPPISNDAKQQHEARPIKVTEEFTVSASGENNFTVRLPATAP